MSQVCKVDEDTPPEGGEEVVHHHENDTVEVDLLREDGAKITTTLGTKLWLITKVNNMIAKGACALAGIDCNEQGNVGVMTIRQVLRIPPEAVDTVFALVVVLSHRTLLAYQRDPVGFKHVWEELPHVLRLMYSLIRFVPHLEEFVKIPDTEVKEGFKNMGTIITVLNSIGILDVSLKKAKQVRDVLWEYVKLFWEIFFIDDADKIEMSFSDSESGEEEEEEEEEKEEGIVPPRPQPIPMHTYEMRMNYLTAVQVGDKLNNLFSVLQSHATPEELAAAGLNVKQHGFIQELQDSCRPELYLSGQPGERLNNSPDPISDQDDDDGEEQVCNSSSSEEKTGENEDARRGGSKPTLGSDGGSTEQHTLHEQSTNRPRQGDIQSLFEKSQAIETSSSERRTNEKDTVRFSFNFKNTIQ